ncbi:MAG: DUF2891 family protein, partial [Anaerolineales bacterium]
MPMPSDPRFSIRPAAPSDRNVISALMRYEPYVHSHLDWRPAEDWLGHQPYLLLERGQRVIGALAAPPDPPHTAWLRLFAVVADASPAAVWDQLWPPTRQELEKLGVQMAAALGLEPWFGPVCARAGFRETHGVIVLERPRGPLTEAPRPATVAIREARPSDYETVFATDLAAFTPPWQMSADVLGQAVPLADLITHRLHAYLPKLTYAVRTGVHSNTAFALILALDYADAMHDAPLRDLIGSRAQDWFGADADCPAWGEPSGEDFLSASLVEALLMRRVLPAD